MLSFVCRFVCVSILCLCDECIVAKRYILQQVSEQVHRKCSLGTRLYNFQSHKPTLSRHWSLFSTYWRYTNKIIIIIIIKLTPPKFQLSHRRILWHSSLSVKWTDVVGWLPPMMPHVFSRGLVWNGSGDLPSTASSVTVGTRRWADTACTVLSDQAGDATRCPLTLRYLNAVITTRQL